MSDPENCLALTDSQQPQATGGYAVGYGKPPVEHRFKHGNQANPKGRRRGSRNRQVLVREVLCEAVTVREGERVRQMPAVEAVLKKMLSKALAGDNKAAITIIGIAQKEGILTPEQEQAVDDLSGSDRAIMEDVKRRLAESNSGLSSEVVANDEPTG